MLSTFKFFILKKNNIFLNGYIVLVRTYEYILN